VSGETVWFSSNVEEWLSAEAAKPKQGEKFKKAKKAIRMMREVGPAYPSFNTHQMDTLKGPGDATIWNSYVENITSQAWRMYWVRCDDGSIQIVSIGPHDHEPGEQPTA
jgi:hypothetical protein